jgi:hypothetical protein
MVWKIIFCDSMKINYLQVSVAWKKYTFAIVAHKHHRSIYEEGDATKQRKRYARPLVELQMFLL